MIGKKQCHTYHYHFEGTPKEIFDQVGKDGLFKLEIDSRTLKMWGMYKGLHEHTNKKGWSLRKDPNLYQSLVHYAKNTEFGQKDMEVLCVQSTFKDPIACTLPNTVPDESIRGVMCNFVAYPSHLQPLYLNKKIIPKAFEDHEEKHQSFYKRFNKGVFDKLFVKSKNPKALWLDMDVENKIGADLLVHIDETKDKRFTKFKKVFGSESVKYNNDENQIKINKLEAHELMDTLIGACTRKNVDRRFYVGLEKVGKAGKAPWWHKWSRRHNKKHRRPNYGNMPGRISVVIKHTFKGFV